MRGGAQAPTETRANWLLHNAPTCAMLMPMTNGALLTAKEKATELGISRSTLSRRVKSGKITPAFKDESNEHNGVMLFDPEPVPA